MKIIERQRSHYLIFAGIISLFICGITLFVWMGSKSIDIVSLPNEKEKPVRKRDFNFDFKKRVDYSFLTKELEAWVKPIRPDAKDNVKIVLSFKRSKEKIELYLDESVYLTFEEGSFFSKEGGLFCLVPTKVEDETIVFTGEKESFNLSKKVFKKEMREGPFLLLSQAKWWRPNLLMESSKERLEIEPHYFLEVKEGDLIIFKDGKWLLSKETIGFPLAKIRGIGSKMEIDLWDASGDKKDLFSLSPQPIQQLKLKANNLLSNIHLRTKKQLSLEIDKQHFILKDGDVLVHKANVWRLSKKKEGFLGEGELFALDEIDLKRRVVRFSLYDPMCTQKQKLEVPISVASQRIERKRR